MKNDYLPALIPAGCGLCRTRFGVWFRSMFTTQDTVLSPDLRPVHHAQAGRQFGLATGHRRRMPQHRPPPGNHRQKEQHCEKRGEKKGRCMR
jgi:hypothetical protein